MLQVVINAFLLALGLILPLGAQNVFVFNQGALQPRYVRALPITITASVCDTLLISLAVFGVSAVALGIAWIKVSLLSIGVLFLLYMGWVIWRSKPSAAKDGQARRLGARRQIALTASLSLLNPHAIMDTVGVIGTSALRYDGLDKLAFAVTCITVSWLWFHGLALAGRIAGKADPSGRFLVALNKISALIMWGTAIYLGLSLFE
ncbi:L-lysine exporter family protein LysE/ArgO [Cohnella sp. OV330]|uniref:LysE/ArgO family amino acid transporter n=1 Tax=Cohnella sp. OV330 TaxID=1855288 RepID=UPI0008E3AC6B|nr:LysE family transporter [Cohnella sp. OV330]SFB07483.1 L-lysine exporter family protein LysE/ArgO [Cohnella sp. OV330]